MSETWLSVDGTPSVKVVLKNIGPYRGIDVTRTLFTFEITSKQSAVVGNQLWLGGRVEVQNLLRHTTLYLASFLPQPQPLVMPQLGTDQTLQLPLDITERQLGLIEENRTDGIRLNIWLAGHAMRDGSQVSVGDAQISHDIGQSDWIAMLQEMGYRRRLLLELDPPDPQAYPDLAEAIDYFLQGQNRYSEGEWRLAVESLRQCLASLVGMKADDEEQAEDVQGGLKELRKVQTGYEPRLELVRRATKFMCDLGAHPEVAETRRHHAYGALLIVGGLLHAFTRANPSE
jgi:hypothetical protein